MALVVVGPHRCLNLEERCTFQPTARYSGYQSMIEFVDHQAMKEISRKRDTVKIMSEPED